MNYIAQIIKTTPVVNIICPLWSCTVPGQHSLSLWESENFRHSDKLLLSCSMEEIKRSALRITFTFNFCGWTFLFVYRMKLLVRSSNGPGVSPALKGKHFKFCQLRLPTIILHTVTAHKFEPNKATLSSALHIYSVCEGGGECSKQRGNREWTRWRRQEWQAHFFVCGMFKGMWIFSPSTLNHQPRNIWLSPHPWCL